MHEDDGRDSEPYDGLTLRIERLYQCLIKLETAPSVDLALAEILRLLAEVMRCDLAYLEAFETAGAPISWFGYGTEAQPADIVRARVSRDLVRAAILKRKTVEGSLPAKHPHRPERTAALCTPLGRVTPVGVLYVEGSTSFGSFDRRRVETIARYLASIHTTLTNTTPPSLGDQVRCLRDQRIHEALELHHGNVAAAARSLGVGRAYIHRYRPRGRSDSD